MNVGVSQVTKVITKQCPQFYVYLAGIITSILVAVKINGNAAIVPGSIAGLMSVLILIGSDYCNWPWKWLVWFFTFSSVLVIIGNIMILSMTDEQVDQIINDNS